MYCLSHYLCPSPHISPPCPLWPSSSPHLWIAVTAAAAAAAVATPSAQLLDRSCCCWWWMWWLSQRRHYLDGQGEGQGTARAPVRFLFTLNARRPSYCLSWLFDSLQAPPSAKPLLVGAGPMTLQAMAHSACCATTMIAALSLTGPSATPSS